MNQFSNMPTTLATLGFNLWLALFAACFVFAFDTRSLLTARPKFTANVRRR